MNRDSDKVYSHFNGSMFKLRYEYKNIFPQNYAQDQLWERREQNDPFGELDSNQSFDIDSFSDNAKIKQTAKEKRAGKLTRISYNLNMLSSMSQEDGQLIDALAFSD